MNESTLRDQLAEALYGWAVTVAGRRPGAYLDPHTERIVQENSRARADALVPVVEGLLEEQYEMVLNAAADALYALPETDGAALRGPYWYRAGFTQAADLLRDWADYPAALAGRMAACREGGAAGARSAVAELRARLAGAGGGVP